MKPVPGLRVTLITSDVQTPYSGMLPGYVAGVYSFDDCHIDLVRLTEFCNARLIHAEASGVNIADQQVEFAGGTRPPLPYDILSLNIGIAPAASQIPGAPQYTIPVKPISTFASRFETVFKEATDPTRDASRAYRVAVVGGGPSGVEISCAVQYRLSEAHKKMVAAAGGDSSADKSSSIPPPPPPEVSLISRREILSGLAPYARSAFLPLLKQRGIHLYETNEGVKRVNKGELVIDDSGNEIQTIPFDACLWCTQASTASWLSSSSLPTDESGFLLVNEYLQALNGPPNVFGAGDCTASSTDPRPKAGVYAVRAGMPLADNIAAFAKNAPMKPWKPQSSHLNLISAGNGYCVGVKGGWLGVQGQYLWKWKDWIDRSFMDKFGADLDFDAMPADQSNTDAVYAIQDPEAASLQAAAKMRCGGCGSKIGASTLHRVLQKLQVRDCQGDGNANANGNGVVVVGGGIGSAPDDAAIVALPPTSTSTVHSVDFFRSCTSDPYRFGFIAAVHALSDCYAMGATPYTAMAIAVLPFAAAAITEADLYQSMAGASAALAQAECALVGGHSCEGAESALGFSVQGIPPQGQSASLLLKSGMVTGQLLVLTKGLGTGVILAASKRGKAQGRWVEGALRSMEQSNATASQVVREYGATACTDVTGFGFLGHLAEMTSASSSVAVKVGVVVKAGSVPVLAGARECVAAGVASSLYEENAKVAAVVGNAHKVAKWPVWQLLVDPQTSGGLLAALPAERAVACVEVLKRRGCEQAAIVGEVVEGGRGVFEGGSSIWVDVV